MNTLEEISIPEIPPGYIRRILTRRDITILEDIKHFAYQYCSTTMKDTYIAYALNKFKRGIVYYKGSTLEGFAIWVERKTCPLHILANVPHELPKPYIDILLIYATTPSELSPLLYGIERYGIKHSIAYITLLPGSDIDLYLKEGYSIENLPRNMSVLTMIKSVKPFKVSKTSTTRRRKCIAEPERGTNFNISNAPL